MANKKPIMSDEVSDQVEMAISQYQNKEKFRRWGLHEIREQGSAILFVGPPGTGKTSIAKYMADRIKRGFRMLTVSTIGGGEPGESERKVDEFFADCRKRNSLSIFLDECNVLLMDRNLVQGEGLTWMIGTTEAIMMNINRYPGLVMAATNHPQKLDKAITDRFLAIVTVARPDHACRLKIWKQKWPTSFPLQLTEGQFNELAGSDLSGRQIENVIIAVGSYCIAKNKKPALSHFKEYAIREMGKHIDNEN